MCIINVGMMAFCCVEHSEIVQPRPAHVGERRQNQLPAVDLQIADVWLGFL